MTAQLSPTPIFRATDGLGFPLYLGRLTTYQAGTTTPQATYVDSTQTTPNTNPIILNARGEAQIWLDPTKAYKFALTDQFGNNIPGWPVDNITIGNANPSFSIIPSVDNLFTLGNASFSWANIYVGPNHAPVLDTVSGNIGYYARTAAEIAISVTPTNFSYPADPYIDPRRYGADPTGVTDSTTALQTALNVAIQVKGCIWIGNGCKYLTGALSVTISSGQSLRVMGSSIQGSILQAKSGLANTSILTLTNPTPLVAPVDSFSVLENFTIQGPSGGIVGGVHGLSTFGIAKLELGGLRIAGFDHGWNAHGVINVLAHRQSEFTFNNQGAIFIDDSVSVPNNLIRIEDSSINLNAKQGLSLNGGTAFYISQCDMEANGTAGDPTTGALFVNGGQSPDLLEAHNVIERCWFEGNHGWTISLLTPVLANNQRTVIKSCEIAGPEGMNYGTTGFTATFSGAVMTVSAISTGTKIEVGMALVSAGNLPTYPIPVVTGLGSGSGGTGTYNVNYAGTIGSGVTITGATNRAISATGNQSLHLEDMQTGGSGDTYYLACSTVTQTDVFVSQLIDTGITVPFYSDVSNGLVGAKTALGRYDVWLATLTGVTGTITANVVTIQNGPLITHYFPDTLTGAANATASCTITGLPAKYQPSAVALFKPAIVENNSVDQPQQMLFVAGSGTIILYWNGSQTGFTVSSGNRGIRKQDVSYRLDL